MADFNFSVSLNDAKTTEGTNIEYKEVPAGDYNVKVADITLKETKESHKPMVAIRYKVAQKGEFEGCCIFQNVLIDTKDKQERFCKQFNFILKGKNIFEMANDWDDVETYLTKLYNKLIDGVYYLEYRVNSKGFGKFTISQLRAKDDGDEYIPF